MENMRKVRKTMMKVLGYLIIFLFMMMTAVGSYQIITRYFFNRPSRVSVEVLTYSFTWMSLLASAYVFGIMFMNLNLGWIECVGIAMVISQVFILSIRSKERS